MFTVRGRLNYGVGYDDTWPLKTGCLLTIEADPKEYTMIPIVSGP